MANHDGASPPANAGDRLMHGENPTSRSVDDIKHWIGAYTELLTFKDGLLRDMERGMKELSKPANSEIQELDVSLILGQRERYLRRLNFWLERQLEFGRPAGSAV